MQKRKRESRYVGASFATSGEAQRAIRSMDLMTDPEIAGRLGLSARRVQQLRNQAEAKLREGLADLVDGGCWGVGIVGDGCDGHDEFRAAIGAAPVK